MRKIKLGGGKGKSALCGRKPEKGTIPRRFQGLQMKQLAFQAEEFKFMLSFFDNSFACFVRSIPLKSWVGVWFACRQHLIENF